MRHRLFKSLRIAVTAVSLLVCGMLIVLWVRSYTYWDELTIRLSNTRTCGIRSSAGIFDTFFVKASRNSGYIPNDAWKYELSRTPPPSIYRPGWSFFNGGTINHQNYYYDGRSIAAPHWFYLTITATIAALPWIKWRFSLRTLLIVLTLFAVLFGAIGVLL